MELLSFSNNLFKQFGLRTSVLNWVTLFYILIEFLEQSLEKKSVADNKNMKIYPEFIKLKDVVAISTQCHLFSPD